MTINLVYNSKSKLLIDKIKNTYKDITIETFDEDHYKEKKRAIQIKSSCGTRLTPFCAIFNDKKELVKAFYTEVKECTFENISKYINDNI